MQSNNAKKDEREWKGRTMCTVVVPETKKILELKTWDELTMIYILECQHKQASIEVAILVGQKRNSKIENYTELPERSNSDSLYAPEEGQKEETDELMKNFRNRLTYRI